MALDTPATNANGSLRYYTEAELAQIDIRRVGVDDGSHVEEEFGPDGSGSTRLYSCAFEERFAAAIVFAGYTKLYESGGEVRISRLLPDSHPGPLALNWVCTKVRIKPQTYLGVIDPTDFGKSMPRFKRSVLECRYELVPFTLLDDDELDATDGEFSRYVIRPGFPGADITVETNYVGMPGGTLVFRTESGTTADGPAGFPIPYAYGFPESYTKKWWVWERCPIDMWGKGKPLTEMVKGDGTPANRGYIGALNLTTFDDHPPLAIQLQGVREALAPDPSGLGYSWRIGYLVSEKHVPYGQLGFHFSDTRDGTNQSGYYQSGRRAAGTTVQAAADITDQECLFHVREFANLFKPGGAS